MPSSIWLLSNLVRCSLPAFESSVADVLVNSIKTVAHDRLHQVVLGGMRLGMTIFIVLSLIFACDGKARAQQYDVVVYGGTPAGIMAAIQSAEMGKQTLLINSNEHVGGVVASGLGATDMNSSRLIGGTARKFFQRIYQYYKNPSAWKAETRDAYFERTLRRIYTGKADQFEMQWAFEPHVALKTFNEMLEDAKVSVSRNERIDLKQGVRKNGNAIVSIKMESGKEFSGKVFIDASYEGDLLAHAGVSYIVGRESNQLYGEKFNGVRGTTIDRLFAAPGSSIHVSPYVVAGDPKSGLLPFIEPKPRGANGDADHGVQSYCFRFTLTDDPKNLRPIEKPKNYDPKWYEIYARICEANPNLELSKLVGIAPLPNRKTDINACNIPGANYQWPDGDYQLRSRLAQLHKDFALGKIWFVANDPRVPENLRKQMQAYGLPKDEFVDNDNFPHQIYVREARRMVSDYVMTEHNELKLGTVTAEDGIAFGSYAVDSHQVGYYVDSEGKLCVDGSLWESARVYPISYRSLVPKEKECSNLIVPVCVSSSHSAYGSIRMEPVYMVMGHSAGTAAAMSIDLQCSVQKVPYDKLRAKLEAQGQVFEAKK